MRLYLYPRNSSLGVVFSRFFKGSLIQDPRFATHYLFLPETSPLELIQFQNNKTFMLCHFDSH